MCPYSQTRRKDEINFHYSRIEIPKIIKLGLDAKGQQVFFSELIINNKETGYVCCEDVNCRSKLRTQNIVTVKKSTSGVNCSELFY